MRSRGFTLIELLVVVAIIAILAAILIPVLGQANAAANATKCSNHLSQIHKGLQLYLTTYGNFFPQTSIGWVGWNNNGTPKCCYSNCCLDRGDVAVEDTHWKTAINAMLAAGERPGSQAFGEAMRPANRLSHYRGCCATGEWGSDTDGGVLARVLPRDLSPIRVGDTTPYDMRTGVGISGVENPPFDVGYPGMSPVFIDPVPGQGAGQYAGNRYVFSGYATVDKFPDSATVPILCEPYRGGIEMPYRLIKRADEDAKDYGFLDYRHLGKSNVLYLDGHIETVNRADGLSHRIFKLWATVKTAY